MEPEYAYTEQDRIEFDRWMQLLPASDEAVFNLMRLQIKHDTAGLHTTVAGYEAFLRDAERVVEALRPLPGIISDLRVQVDAQAARLAELNTSILERRALLDQRVAAIEHAPPRIPRWALALFSMLAVVDVAEIAALLWLVWRLAP